MPTIVPRNHDSYKGNFGHVVVLACSRGMLGAGILTAKACLRSGAGLVSLALPASLALTAHAAVLELMTIPLPENPEGGISFRALKTLYRLFSDKTVAAIGPGLGRSKEVGRLVREILVKLDLPVILDADGINALDGKTDLLLKRSKPTILTPHAGEMGRLIGVGSSYVQKNREEVAIEFAKKYNVVLLLKGAGTVVTNGNSIFVNKTGNPGMATAGTGDVLAGIVSAFLAQGLSPFDAAILGAHIHGLAGDFAKKSWGEISLIASDIIESIPQALLGNAQSLIKTDS